MTGRSWGVEGLGEVTHMMASPRREAEPGVEVLREGQGTVTVFPAGPGTLAGTLSSPCYEVEAMGWLGNEPS